MARPSSPDNARQALHDLIEQTGDDAAGLSRMIGRYSGYLRSFINGIGVAELTTNNRDRLAAYFGVSPDALGMHSTWAAGDTRADHLPPPPARARPKRLRPPADDQFVHPLAGARRRGR